MTTDDRLTRHLEQQAEQITLAPADAAAVMRRGARRRTRRRAGVVGGVAVVGLLGAALAVRDPGGPQEVRFAQAPNVAASSFDWSTLEPSSGLAYGHRTAELADGSIFGLSTAPGPYDESDPAGSQAPALYRSTDGAEWEPVALPSGHRTADLAGAGSTLFSVGTSPAGGLVLSSSSDGAATWSSTALPGDLAALKARHGDELAIVGAQVAALDATHVVAATVVTTNLDLGDYRPEYRDGGYSWRWDDTGVTVYAPEHEVCEPEAMEAAGVAAAEDGARDAVATCSYRTERADGPGREVARFTYDELGIESELRDHLGGKVYAYVTSDGQEFRQVAVPSAAGGVFGAVPVATSDGYRLVVTRSDEVAGTSTQVLTSADGEAWTESAVLPGALGGAGLVGGRPAVAILDEQGGSTVRIEVGDGTWTELDLTRVIEVPEGGDAQVGTVAFGPLGLAAVVFSHDDDGDRLGHHLVHSGDGAVLEVVDLDELTDDPGTIAGMVVTADAIVARFVHATDDDLTTPPTQTVLVGTPAG